MFLKIRNHIINSDEIRSVHLNGNTIWVHFKDYGVTANNSVWIEYEKVSTAKEKFEEIMAQLSEAK